MNLKYFSCVSQTLNFLVILFNFKLPAKPKKATKPKSPKKAAKKAGAKKGKPVFLHIKKLIDFKGMHYSILSSFVRVFHLQAIPISKPIFIKKKLKVLDIRYLVLKSSW